MEAPLGLRQARRAFHSIAGSFHGPADLRQAVTRKTDEMTVSPAMRYNGRRRSNHGHIRRREIITRTDDSYRVAVPLVAAYVRGQAP